MSVTIQPDYSLFASPTFDPNQYATAILAGEPYHQITKVSAPESFAKDDISLAISKLSLGIEDVSKQIKSLVTTYHEDLLSQAASANQLSGSLTSVKSDLTDLDSSVEKLRRKISLPYQSLNTSLSRLQKFQQASDVLRRTSRFVVLARRLQGQMVEMENYPDNQVNGTHSLPQSISAISAGLLGDSGDEKERTIAKAALSIAELVALIDGPGSSESAVQVDNTIGGGNFNLRSANAIAIHIPFIEEARTKITNEMENMVITGLTTLNQSLLASSLQTAYNLRVLPQQVQTLMSELAQDVEDRIKRAFDLTRISKDASNKDGNANSNLGASGGQQYKSRVRTEPTSVTAPQWTAALWARLEKMTEEMADCCIKVYTLEKVLKLKRDTVSQTVFLDEAMKALENKPSATFWTALSRALEKHARDSARGSTFIQQTLSTGYPKLLRLFHEFFAKIAVHTDTVYSPTYQSPETVLVLRSLTYFETLYLSRSTNKLNEGVAQAFPSSGARASPTANDGINIARTVTNELDSARFDPLFVRSVAKNIVSSLEMMISRADSLIVKDRSAVLLSGPSATPSQILNASVATCLYHCHSRLVKLQEEHGSALYQLISPSADKLRLTFERVVDPLLTAIRRELGAIIARLHRIDFSKSAERAGGMGGSSFYMKDLVDKLSFIKAEILSKYMVEEVGHDWVMSIVKFVLRTFVLHVSITQPLSESGKLQLTADMTELEFALSAFLVDGSQSKKRGGDLESLGDEYRLLRAMRPLLFLENGQLANSTSTSGVPPLIVLHHILVRSPLPLPHTLHGWREDEYVRWVDEHSEEEARTLIEGGLDHWEKTAETEGKDSKEAEEYVSLARTVLRNAQ